LSQALNIPVTSSLKGKGTVDEHSERSLGCLGVTSSGYAFDYIVNIADLVIVLGASFNERTSYLWNNKLLKDKNVVQIDINDQQLNKVYQADLCIHADIKQTLEAVIQKINGHEIKKKNLLDIGEYKNSIEEKSTLEGNSIFQAEFTLVKYLFEKMNSVFTEGITIFDDNIIFAQNLLNVTTKNNFYPNAGISSLGHALPAAIGAQFHEKTTMFAIMGDGGFQMCCMEIMTAVNYQIPLNIILFNNSSMGLIRKNQIQSYEERFIDCDFINPDYKQLADAFGINHILIDSEEQLDSLFSNTNFTDDINLIEIIIDKNAFPNYSSRR
jgi:acetolactate synthase I/II/III large subunit